MGIDSWFRKKSEAPTNETAPGQPEEVSLTPEDKERMNAAVQGRLSEIHTTDPDRAYFIAGQLEKGNLKEAFSSTDDEYWKAVRPDRSRM